MFIGEEFIDQTLANEPSSIQYLLLELNSQQLLFAKHHLAKNKLAHCGVIKAPDNTSDVRKALQSLVLQGDFEQSLLSFVTSNYCIVPRTFMGDDLHKIFSLTNELNEEEEVLLNYPLVNLRANVLYTIPKEIQSVIYEAKPQAKLIPHIAPRIENVLNKKDTETSVLAHISEQHVDVLVFTKGQLQLANSFYQAGKEDIAYYTLFVCEALAINSQSTTLLVSGVIQNNDECHQLLTKYWKKVEAPKPLSTLENNTKLAEAPAHHFNHLSQLLLCAS